MFNNGNQQNSAGNMINANGQTVSGGNQLNQQQVQPVVNQQPVNGAVTQQQYYQQSPDIQGQRNVAQPDTNSSQVHQDWDILFGEDNQLRIVPRNANNFQGNNLQQQVQQQIQGSQTLNGLDNLNNPQGLQQSPYNPQQQSNPADTKIQQLERNVADLTNLLVALVGQQGQGQQQVQQQVPQFDLSQPESLMNAIQQTVQQTVSKLITPHTQTMEDMRVRMNFATAAAMYGQDFQQKLPYIKTLLESDPSLSFDKAYLAIKQIEAGLGQNRQGQDSTTQQQGQQHWQMNPQQVINRSQQLVTEAMNGHSPYYDNNAGGVKVNNVADAVNLALNQLYSGQG